MISTNYVNKPFFLVVSEMQIQMSAFLDELFKITLLNTNMPILYYFNHQTFAQHNSKSSSSFN